MKASSVPNLMQDKNTRNEGKIKHMMRNHHFDFGNDKPNFSSTVSASFVPHAIILNKPT